MDCNSIIYDCYYELESKYNKTPFDLSTIEQQLIKNAKNTEAIKALLSGVPNPQQLAEEDFSIDGNALTNAVRFGNVDCVAAVLAGVPNP
jgi:hypothetical protein